MVLEGRALRERLRYIRKRSTEKGLPCDLTEAQLQELLRGSGQACPCCRIAFKEGSKKKMRTIDRVEPVLGYTLSNLQVLCGKCNRKKGTAVVRYGR